MKKILAVTLAMCLTISIANAAPDLKGAIKSDLNATKNAIKKDMTKEKQEQNKNKKDLLKQKRDAQIGTINTQIKEKESLIKTTKKDSTLSETQKTLRIRAYERQIEAFKTKKENVDNLYNTNLKVLGY